jgi:hypothetical protein
MMNSIYNLNLLTIDVQVNLRKKNQRKQLSWIANTLGITFMDSNNWMEERDFGRDGLHLNGRGRSRLEQLYARVNGLDGSGSKGQKE